MKWLIVLLPLILLAIPVHASNMTLDWTHDIADARVRNTSATTNFGATNPLEIWDFTTTKFVARSYLMFNIDDLIDINATITDAQLGLGLYTTGGGVAYVLAYNTTLAWNETNITWDTAPAAGTLQSNTSTDLRTAAGYKWFNVTNAVISAKGAGKNVSIMIRLDKEGNSSSGIGNTPASKEYVLESYRPKMNITYTTPDCAVDCPCGCDDTNAGCFVPSIIGSYCDMSASTNGITTQVIKTVPDATCSSNISYFTCPNTTFCTQVSPVVNMSVYPTTPGEANVSYCKLCIFWNIKIATAPLASTYNWVNVWTNCPNNPECNCNSWACSGETYEAPNITNVTYSVTEWTAGCFNPSSGLFPIVINGTGYNTTITDLVNNTCGTNCNLTNNTPQTTCSVNTTTLCYDSACNIVPCAVSPLTTCSGSSGGQLALAVGGLMGITDCGLAENILAILTSIIIGFAIMFYTKDSEHSGQAFIFGTISMLVMFTLIGWFASWLMVLLIVIGAYLVAKSLGVGGG